MCHVCVSCSSHSVWGTPTAGGMLASASVLLCYATSEGASPLYSHAQELDLGQWRSPEARTEGLVLSEFLC